MESSNNQPDIKYIHQNATSYAGHPGYNQNTGIYSYGSGYQDYESRSTSTSTSALLKGSSYTTDSCNLSKNGQSFATQYATNSNVTASYNQQPTITSSGNSYFNLPYGTATFLENGYDNQSTGSISHSFSTANSIDLQPVISDNKNSTTYMQSNSQISTSTTNSAETRDIPQTSHESTTNGPQ